MKTFKKLVIPNEVRNLIKFNRTVVIFLSFTMIILSNGASAQKVGITDDSADPPTFAPKSLLHVHHELATGSIFQITNSTSGDLVTDGFLINLVTTSNKLELINKENAGMSFWTNNTERLTILSDGKVGIGTTTPAYKLDVNGDLNLQSKILINGTATATKVLKTDASGNPVWGVDDNTTYTGGTGISITGTQIDNTAPWTDNSGSYIQNQNAVDQAANFRITGDGYLGGNVGIGTTSPGTKLDVAGNVNLNNAAYTGAGTLNRGYYVYKSATTAYGIKLHYDGSQYGTMVFGPNQANRFVNFGKVGAALEDDDMIEYMRIDLDNGRVGIGTTAPAQKLHVVGNIRATSLESGANGAIVRTNTSGDMALTNFTGSATQVLLGNATFGTANTSGTAWQLTGNSAAATNFIGTTNAIDFRIYTNNAERMTVEANGNVGIGTTSPGYKLDVAGTGRFTNTLYANSNIRVDAGNTPTIFFDAAGTGDVGIRANGDNLEIYEPEDGNKIWARFTDDSNLHLIGTPHLYVDGNVGIGTTSPAAQLHTTGTVRFANYPSSDANGAILKTNTSGDISTTNFTGNTDQVLLGNATFGTANTSGTAWQLTGNAAAAANFIGTTNAIDFRIYTSNAERMTVEANGNVGIGTTSPSQKLSVNGNIEVLGNNYIGMQENNYINRRFEMIENTSPQYIILCVNGANNDVNGRIQMDRTSGNYQSSIVDVIVSSGTSAMYGGTLRTLQVLQNSERYQLVTITYSGVSYVAIKYTGNTYPETTGSYFTGRLVNSGSNTLTVVNSSDVSNEVPFGGTSKADFDVSYLTTNGNVGIGTTAPTAQLHTTGTMRFANYPSGGNGAIIKTDASGNLGITNFSGSATDVLLGNGSFGPGSAFGDNLGNHTATTNLNMTNHEIDNTTYYDVLAGNGYGIRFWQSNSYKISMGNAAEYKYGPVTDYSIKMNMSNTSTRGWTWGVTGVAPVAAINTQGILQIANALKIDGNTVIDDGGGWHRSYGNTGWYNGTWGGGVWMDQGTYVRVYNGKGFTVPGNVGIGTTAPSTKLDVNGTVRIRGGSPSKGRVLTATDANGNAIWESASDKGFNIATGIHPSFDDMSWIYLRNASCGDDVTHNIPWGFNFYINGTAYTSGWISTNGVLGFGSSPSTSWSNTSLPASISNDPMVFFHWDDNSAYYITYCILGSSPGRVCYVHWQGYESLNCSGGYMYMQLVIHEATSVVEVVYSDINSNTYSRGSSATFGAQTAGGASAQALMLGYNAPILDDNHDGLSFSVQFPK